MSTRATVLLRQPSTDERAYLYHHCDGYDLDCDLDKVLKNFSDKPWEIKTIAQAIIDFDDAYGRHKVNDIGWDSEYVYVIDLDERTLKKYDCGLWFFDDHKGDQMPIEEEKTQEKYLSRTITYPSLSEDEVKEKVNAFALALRTVVDAMAKTSGLSDGMKKQAVEKAYKLICQ